MKNNVDLLKNRSSNNRQHCIEFLEAFEAHDIDAMLHRCTPDATVQFIPLGKSFAGNVHSLGRIFWNAFLESFSDLKIIFHHTNWVEEDADRITMLITLQALHTYTFAGIKSEGRELNCKHLVIFQLNENSKITNIEVSWNHREMKAQLTDRH
jgi:predicted ester cyclase